MNVYVEDRWDYGGYGYWVYRLDEQGGIREAESRMEKVSEADKYNYDTLNLKDRK